MTREDIIDLLTFARVYDSRVTVGKAEAAAWFLAIGRVPFDVAQTAVTAHYSAPAEPGREVPKIAPGHVWSRYQSANWAHDKPVPALPPAPQSSPEYVAECREQMGRLIDEAAARWKLQDEADDEYGPKWRPGMDKRELAAAQAEAARQRRTGGLS